MSTCTHSLFCCDSQFLLFWSKFSWLGWGTNSSWQYILVQSVTLYGQVWKLANDQEVHVYNKVQERYSAINEFHLSHWVHASIHHSSSCALWSLIIGGSWSGSFYWCSIHQSQMRIQRIKHVVTCMYTTYSCLTLIRFSKLGQRNGRGAARRCSGAPTSPPPLHFQFQNASYLHFLSQQNACSLRGHHSGHTTSGVTYNTPPILILINKRPEQSSN